MRRPVVRAVVIVLVSLAFLAAVTALVAGSDHPGPVPPPWTDDRLAAALTQVAVLGRPIRPGDVAEILAQACPYLSDPAGLVRYEHASSEAEADALESVLAQSGRC